MLVKALFYHGEHGFTRKNKSVSYSVILCVPPWLKDF